ncbi:DUF4166 domain-containing protein [Paenarthrobacter sp. PH39-S1]|uniref:DUF4166 domain-containing protein n=1 Tax=Micrococcaceae TaxID=1268 RepID=UPI0024BB3E6E|nr:DUF4166 domain-containing protein [Paenarthrobacter sp. PH39-S1]MDJ0356458.1 DUF4166 domain-containing protein [Paenarthrobacter sp. PH39-S1]
MSGIYEQALGEDFRRLQPEVQDYFSLEPGSGSYGVGNGTFDVAGCPQPWLRPLLKLSTGEEAFFPEYGTAVPFRIENHAHLDPFGRASLTARREISFPHVTRLFQDTTSLQTTGSRNTLVDYVGKYRRLVTDLNVSVTPDGLLRGVSQRSRLLAGKVRLPLPALLDARAYAQQWWDRGTERHRIQVKVIQPQLGVVLVYAGSFDYTLVPYPAHEAAAHGVLGSLPSYAQPAQWEARV